MVLSSTKKILTVHVRMCGAPLNFFSNVPLRLDLGYFICYPIAVVGLGNTVASAVYEQTSASGRLPTFRLKIPYRSEKQTCKQEQNDATSFTSLFKQRGTDQSADHRFCHWGQVLSQCPSILIRLTMHCQRAAATEEETVLYIPTCERREVQRWRGREKWGV